MKLQKVPLESNHVLVDGHMRVRVWRSVSRGHAGVHTLDSQLLFVEQPAKFRRSLLGGISASGAQPTQHQLRSGGAAAGCAQPIQRGAIGCTNASLQSIVAPEPNAKLIDRSARSDVP